MSDHPTLSELDAAQPFTSRHIGPDADARATMLKALGFDTLEDLMQAAVPGGIRTEALLDLPAAASEEQAARELRAIAAENTPREPMIGLGYHGTTTPAVVRRNVLEDPSWYTAYTPYQPEISQGRLEALLNFQTMVGDLTGLPTANASLLDEGTAVAEAVTVMRRASRVKAERVVVDADLLPQSLAVLQTRCRAIGVEVVVADEVPAVESVTAAVTVTGPPELNVEPGAGLVSATDNVAVGGALTVTVAVAEAVEAWCDLDHDRRHVPPGKEPARKSAEITHGLRLQLVDEDIGADRRH